MACLGLLALPGAAQAQAGPRVTIAVNGGYQPTTTEFGERFTFELDRETASTQVRYPIDAGALFDAGAAVRLWGGLGAGVAVSRFSRNGSAATTSSLPHPLFLERNREVVGEATGLDRRETGIHLQAQYALPPLAGLRIVLAAGPSRVEVEQGMVDAVRYAEEYPYDTATYTGVRSETVAESALGFNAGADVQYMFTPAIGAGVLLRVTRATIALTTPRNGTVAVDAGGVHLGAGIRVRF
jgi:hypothetical protein